MSVFWLYPPNAGCSWLQVPWGCVGQGSVQYSDSPLILLFSFTPHSFPSLGLVLVSISGHTTHPIPCWAGGRVAAHKSQMEIETRIFFKDIQRTCFQSPFTVASPTPKQGPLPKPIRERWGRALKWLALHWPLSLICKVSCYLSICFHIYTPRATCSCILPFIKDKV